MKYRILIVLFLSSVLVLQGCASKEASVNYNSSETEIAEKNQNLIEKIYGKESYPEEKTNIDPVSLNSEVPDISKTKSEDKYDYVETIEEEEPLSLHEKELEMIKQALLRCKGKRKLAAKELGISERTLYRKIKQFDLNDIES